LRLHLGDTFALPANESLLVLGVVPSLVLLLNPPYHSSSLFKLITAPRPSNETSKPMSRQRPTKFSVYWTTLPALSASAKPWNHPRSRGWGWRMARKRAQAS